MKGAKMIPALALCLAVGQTVEAAVDGPYSDGYLDDIPTPTATNWGPITLQVPQFDSSLGTLTNVTIEYELLVEGEIGVENVDPVGRNATATLAADSTLDLSGLTLGDLMLSFTNSIDIALDPFDGVSDFDGPSGENLVDLGGEDSTTVATSAAADLLAFTGNGTIGFDAVAVGNSSATGPGNYDTRIRTRAGALLTVTYTYTPIPTTVACGVNLRTSGNDAVTISVNGGESCADIGFTKQYSCTGDLALEAVASNLPATCNIAPPLPGSDFDVTCVGDPTVAPGGSVTFAFDGDLSGTEGTCTTTVTNLSCVTATTSQVIVGAGCADAINIDNPDPGDPGEETPPVENVPTMSQWGLVLLAGLLALFGAGGIRGRRD